MSKSRWPRLLLVMGFALGMLEGVLVPLELHGRSVMSGHPGLAV